VNLKQLAPKAAILSEITRNDGYWSFKVTQGDLQTGIGVGVKIVSKLSRFYELRCRDDCIISFGTDRKPACDFLLVNNNV